MVAGSTAELAAAASASSPSPAGDALKDHLAELFRQFDADGNGRLDVQEFREAMKHLGNELSAASVRSMPSMPRSRLLSAVMPALRAAQLALKRSQNLCSTVAGECHLHQPRHTRVGWLG
jgi:hypothetical protein